MCVCCGSLKFSSSNEKKDDHIEFFGWGGGDLYDFGWGGGFV